MFMTLPSARYLRTLGSHAFESENALQKFFEKRVWPEAGLRVVCSSRRNHGRLGNIDTIALDKRKRPVVIEYKRDVVDQKTLEQLARYREWLLKNKRVVAEAAGVAPDWTRIYLVSVGHMYDWEIRWPSFPGTHVRPLRYGYREKGIVVLKRVKPGIRATYGEERARRFSKARAFRKHLRKTTNAGRRAFELLTRELRRLGFTRRFPGKNRVRYWRNDVLHAEVTLIPVGLHVCFRSSEQIDDPEGRVGRSKKAVLPQAIGILCPADVPYAVKVLQR